MKKAQQRSLGKEINKKQITSIVKAEESINIASNNIRDNFTAKSLSKSSQRQKLSALTSPLVIKDVQKENKSILREFPQPDQYNVLKMSGILDAYQHFLKLLCKHGLPTGRVYQYAAQQIEKYERRKLNKELKMRAQLDIQKIKKNKPQKSPEKSPERASHLAASPYLQH